MLENFKKTQKALIFLALLAIVSSNYSRKTIKVNNSFNKEELKKEYFSESTYSLKKRIAINKNNDEVEENYEDNFDELDKVMIQSIFPSKDNIILETNDEILDVQDEEEKNDEEIIDLENGSEEQSNEDEESTLEENKIEEPALEDTNVNEEPNLDDGEYSTLEENEKTNIPVIPIPSLSEEVSPLERELIARYKFELEDDLQWKTCICILLGETGTGYVNMYEVISCVLDRYVSYRWTTYTNTIYGLLTAKYQFDAYNGDWYNYYMEWSLDDLRELPAYSAIVDCLYSEIPNHNFSQFRDPSLNIGTQLSPGGEKFLDPLGDDEYRPLENRKYYQKVVEVLSNKDHELYDLFLKIPEDDMPSIKYYNSINASKEENTDNTLESDENNEITEDVVSNDDILNDEDVINQNKRVRRIPTR